MVSAASFMKTVGILQGCAFSCRLLNGLMALWTKAVRRQPAKVSDRRLPDGETATRDGIHSTAERTPRPCPLGFALPPQGVTKLKDTRSGTKLQERYKKAACTVELRGPCRATCASGPSRQHCLRSVRERAASTYVGRHQTIDTSAGGTGVGQNAAHEGPRHPAGGALQGAQSATTTCDRNQD